MHLPSNFLARVKDITRRQSRGFGRDTSRIVGQWFFILIFTFVSVVLAISFAVYRFSYWSAIEDTVAREEVSTAEYDEEAIERILKEFSEKEEATKELMSEPLPQSVEVTATTTEPVIVEEDNSETEEVQDQVNLD